MIRRFFTSLAIAGALLVLGPTEGFVHNVPPTVRQSRDCVVAREGVELLRISLNSNTHDSFGIKKSTRPRRHGVSALVRLSMTSRSDKKDNYFDPRTTVALIGGQSVLILVAAILSLLLGTPNFGFGPGVSFDASSIRAGGLLAVPLGLLAAALDAVEDQYPALQDVTKATQRSVLGLLGGTFKPITALMVSIALGLAAGVGEEMLFRGLLQYELTSRVGSFLALLLSSILFGLLHAVTPLYALMASLASVYFGFLYVLFNNLAVPIACHSIYDIGALMYAHWTVSRLSDEERKDLALWDGPEPSQ